MRTSIRPSALTAATLAAATLAAAALLATGCGTAHESAAPVVAPAMTVTAAAQSEQVAAPVRVRIPRIGVDAAVLALELDPHGVLPPPPTNHETGWWRAGPEPGEAGPAVVVGHVDSREGPAVFFRLRDLDPGDRIAVDRIDGTTAEFTVVRTERYGKNSFPTAEVYGDTTNAQLRLITCGGAFDRRSGHYLDNVVVYADRTG
jgi:sortase (surface protein transpeptidase)